MKANTSKLLRRGYGSGVFSGMTWGLDTVLIGVAMLLTPFVENPILLVGGTFICSMLHDVFAAFWMTIIMGVKGELKNLKVAITSRDGLFCVLGALFGGPLAMTFYMLAIAKGGPALTATVTACYPLLGSALAVLILKEKMSLRSWMGLLVCICGIVFIGFSPIGGENINYIGGIMLAAVAAIGWATEAVVCGYGMKAGNVNPQMALLIRELTSGLTYIFIVAPIMLGGYGKMAMGTIAVFEYFPAWSILLLTALIGMSSFFMWYTAIDLIGAARALCLNVTYSFWAVVFTFIFMRSAITVNILIGSLMVIAGVVLATVITKKDKVAEKKAIILAAGMGTRLRPLTNEIPKCLVPVNGVPMIERQIQFLHDMGIYKITLVSGYKAEKLDYLKEKFGVEIVFNEKYDVCNNIYSMYIVRDLLRNAYVVEGDVYMDKNCFRNDLNKSSYFSVWKDDYVNEWGLNIDGENHLKSIEIGMVKGYIMSGISYWTEEDGQKVSDRLEEIIAKNDYKDLFWDNAVIDIQKNLDIDVIGIDGIYEIDTEPELRALESKLK